MSMDVHGCSWTQGCQWTPTDVDVMVPNGAHGCPWTTMKAHGCPRISTDANGCLWVPMDAHGWVLTDALGCPHGCPWMPIMKVHRCSRVPMDVQGCSQMPTGAHGCQRTPTGDHGCPRVPMDAHGAHACHVGSYHRFGFATIQEIADFFKGLFLWGKEIT